jgi:hypothetical protein
VDADPDEGDLAVEQQEAISAPEVAAANQLREREGDDRRQRQGGDDRHQQDGEPGRDPAFLLQPAGDGGDRAENEIAGENEPDPEEQAPGRGKAVAAERGDQAEHGPHRRQDEQLDRDSPQPHHADLRPVHVSRTGPIARIGRLAKEKRLFATSSLPANGRGPPSPAFGNQAAGNGRWRFSIGWVDAAGCGRRRR